MTGEEIITDYLSGRGAGYSFLQRDEVLRELKIAHGKVLGVHSWSFMEVTKGVDIGDDNHILFSAIDPMNPFNLTRVSSTKASGLAVSIPRFVQSQIADSGNVAAFSIDAGEKRFTFTDFFAPGDTITFEGQSKPSDPEDSSDWEPEWDTQFHDILTSAMFMRSDAINKEERGRDRYQFWYEEYNRIMTAMERYYGE